MQTKGLTREHGSGILANEAGRHGQYPPAGDPGRARFQHGRGYLRKIGRACWISGGQDHLRLARPARRPIARLTSLLHGWSLRWRTKERRNPRQETQPWQHPGAQWRNRKSRLAEPRVSLRRGTITFEICPSLPYVSLPSHRWACSVLFHWPVGFQRFLLWTNRESPRFHRSVRRRHDSQAQ